MKFRPAHIAELTEREFYTAVALLFEALGAVLELEDRPPTLWQNRAIIVTISQPALKGQTMSADQKPQTFGERAVGLTFNPSGDDAVAKIKRRYADLIDDLNDRRISLEGPGAGDVGRMLSIAITDAQASQMWAVKAVTWRF